MALSEAARKGFDEMKFYAFDSFAGLPEVAGIDVLGEWFKKGDLCTSLERFKELINEHGLFLENISYIKGFYEDSLNDELANEFKNSNVKAGIIYIDCDLYSSAKCVLEFIAKADIIQDGTILAFDDWDLYRGNPNKGERLAFREFKQSLERQSPGVWSFDEYRKFSSASNSFIAQRLK